jgi:hypothetical protein
VQIAFSMETMMNPAQLTIEEVVGHLRVVEERLDGKRTDAGGQLLLTKEQWDEKFKQGSGGGSSKNARGNSRDRGDSGGTRSTSQANGKAVAPAAAMVFKAS